MSLWMESSRAKRGRRPSAGLNRREHVASDRSRSWLSALMRCNLIRETSLTQLPRQAGRKGGCGAPRLFAAQTLCPSASFLPARTRRKETGENPHDVKVVDDCSNARFRGTLRRSGPFRTSLSGEQSPPLRFLRFELHARRSLPRSYQDLLRVRCASLLPEYTAVASGPATGGDEL